VKRLVAAVALLVAVATVAPARAQDQAEITYAAVSQALTLVERASQAPESERPALLNAAREALDSRPELATPWLREPLAANPPDIDQARARLSAARAALAPPAAGRVDTRAASDALDRVLNSPPFSSWSWLALVPAVLLPVALLVQHVAEAIWNAMRWPFDRVLDLLNRLFEGLFYTPAVPALAFLATVLLVLLYRRGLRSAIVAQAEIASSPAELPPTAAEALAAAQRDAAEGRYRDASHFVFLSTLLWLEERGQARFTPAATNREYLAQIAAQPGVAAALAPVVARFDRMWYGQDGVDDADYHDLLAAATHLREAAA
jgi:hypothetical protein